MSVGLLIITHRDIGASLLAAATRILGKCPLPADVLGIHEEHMCDDLRLQALRMADRLDQGDGLLVLTDLYGSTPGNIAHSLQSHRPVQILAGVNLPMLVRVLNYAALPLEELIVKARSGGEEGIYLYPGNDSPGNDGRSEGGQ